MVYCTLILTTTYTGACIVLWPGTGTATSTDWYGIGMNAEQLVYHVPSGTGTTH